MGKAEKEGKWNLLFWSNYTWPVIENLKKKLQKNSKNYKTPLELLFKLKQDGKGQEREKLKIIVSFNSYPTGYRKFQKNSEN